MLLFGLLPGWTAVSWAAVVVCFLLGEFGPGLRLPQWLLDVSPFTHVPRLAATAVAGAGGPIGWLVGLAVLLALLGLAGFRRRDLATG